MDIYGSMEVKFYAFLSAALREDRVVSFNF
jgi:hypothetical protein